MEKRQEDIVMLKDILDYLNNHEARKLLELSETKLKEIEMIPETQWPRGTDTNQRQLVQIRKALRTRLNLPDDKNT